MRRRRAPNGPRPRRTGSCRTGSWTSARRLSASSRRSRASRPSIATTRTRAASARCGRTRSSSARRSGASTPSPSCWSAMSSESLRRARILVAVIVVGLLGGTAAAFALTEQLKLERSPVYRTHVGKLLGPDCHCGLATTPIRFVLRKPETLTVTIVDSNDRVVRTLLSRTSRPKGVQRFHWDGRDDSGRVVPDGTYKPRLHLARDHRTILMPNPIHVH